MSNAYLSPILQDAQFADDGTFLSGGLIWFYEAGTSTPLLAYTTSIADTAWSNPIQLNSRGETGGEIWLKSGSSYKMVLESEPQYGQTHGPVISTFDNITGVNDPGTTSVQNWVAFSGTPIPINDTSLYVVGDHRSTFLVGRRIKMVNSDGSTNYATTVNSSYALGSTTINVSPDYGQIVSPLLVSISYGFIETGNVSSIPVAVNVGSAFGGSDHSLWMTYNGTNMYWSADSGAPSYAWPIIAAEASTAHGGTFSTAIATSGEAQLIAKYTGVNDAYLYNTATRWGIYSADGGLGVEYNRSTSKFSFGGFTLPDPSTTKYIKLPNGLIVQFGQGTASNAGTAVTFPTSFPNLCVSVVATDISSVHNAISANSLSTTGFTAYCASTGPVSYIAFGY